MSNYTESEEFQNHLKALDAWLDENVQSYENPKKIKLNNFEINWESLSGSFNLTLDGVLISERISFEPEISGKPTLYFPMFHSPLGVPASYAMIELTWETRECILKQLKILLPRFFNGEMCDLSRNKLDELALECIKKKVMNPKLTLEFDMSYDFKIN